jgi:selenide,water dikinase
VLRPVKDLFSPADYPDLLAGLDSPDDAAVWRINDEQAIVLTTDFFTPIVDDPYDYGAVAAANSLSDVYAMGGRPFLALNVAALPPQLPVEFLGEILRGGAEKCREAGVVVAGGHTIKDSEPKYGLAVVGFVDPQRILTKGGCRPGDVLILTKPLGTGTTMTALKNDLAEPAHVSEAVGWMKRLNDRASQLALDCRAHAATDITGFSLLGHAWEMASSSTVGMRLDYSQIPFLSGAGQYAAKFIFPGGAADNRLYFNSHVHFSPDIDEARQMLLFDPQTSGGLLFSIAPDMLSKCSLRAAELNQPFWQIGNVVEGQHIFVQ